MKGETTYLARRTHLHEQQAIVLVFTPNTANKPNTRRNTMKKQWYYLSGTVLAALIHPLPASVVLEESFNYPDGPIVGAPGSSWEAHSAAGNGPVLVENGWLRLAFDRAEDINAPLQGAPYEPAGTVSTLYAGFTLRVTSLPTTTGAYFAHFRNSTTAHRARVWISRAGGDPDRFRLGIGNSGGASASSGPWPADLTPDTDYRVVIRYNVATGLSSIWVNPTAESEPGATATDAVGLINISTFALRQSADIGTIQLDELRIGDTFADAAAAGVRLRITQLGTDLQLSWPATATGYVAQASPDLVDPAWVDLPDTPVLQDDRYVLRVPGDGAPHYFRLIKR
jgi:hypothetical protein